MPLIHPTDLKGYISNMPYTKAEDTGVRLKAAQTHWFAEEVCAPSHHTLLIACNVLISLFIVFFQLFLLSP